MLKDIWDVLKSRKKAWLLPMIFTLMVFGGLLVFVVGGNISTFSYKLF